MSQIEKKILDFFKNNPETEHSTSEIIDYSNKELNRRINLLLNSSDPKLVEQGRKEKAKLHRKTLYYLNKLVDRELIKYVREGKNNEKFFSINLDLDEELVYRGKDSYLVIKRKYGFFSSPIEGFEKQGIVSKFKGETWVDRLNSVLINCNLVDISAEYEKIISLFSNINDVLCFYSFDTFINLQDLENIERILKSLFDEAESYDKFLSFIISFDKVDKSKLFDFCILISKKVINNYSITLDLDLKQVKENSDFFVKLFSDKRIDFSRISFKNENIDKKPYFKGRAGTYSFNEKEWLEHKNKPLVVCSISTIDLDISKLFSDKNNFATLLSKLSKTFVLLNSIQRRNFNDYFRYILNFSNAGENFFSISRNFIRFKNFSDSLNALEEASFLIKKAKKWVEDFSKYEEMIYLLCGMPSRFKIALSSEDFVFYFNELSDLLEEKNRKKIFFREIYLSSLDGGGCANFVNQHFVSETKSFLDLVMILSEFSFPYFSYIPKKRFQDLKLDLFVK